MARYGGAIPANTIRSVRADFGDAGTSNVEIRDLLNRISINTEHSPGISLELTGDTSDFTTQLSQPLLLKADKWQVRLVNFSSYYGCQNITSVNNVFTYNNGTTWKTLTLAPGTYSISDINSQVQLGITSKGDNAGAITISANDINGTSIVNITSSVYQVDFTVANTIGRALGFNSVILTATSAGGSGYNISQNKAALMPVVKLLVNCSIITNSFLNSTMSQTIYSFPPNYVPFQLISEIPVSPEPFPITSDNITNIRIWITDQDGNAVSLNNTVSVRLRFETY